MTNTRTMMKKLDFLARTTGRPEEDIMGEAIRQGVDDLYRHQMAESYLAGRLDRKKAVAELGADAVEELDYARKSVEADVQWALKTA